MTAPRRILAVGGKQLDHPELTGFLVECTGAVRPRVLFVATASGDSPDYIERFYAAFTDVICEPAHLPLFTRPDDILTPISRADAIVVGGGNTANLLAVWRLHGVDRAIRGAYERGCVLSGWSAGCICWFADGVTDSFGQTLRPLGDGLGWLSATACPHYDGEPERRPTLLSAVKSGRIAPGYAADDGVALVFTNETFAGAVSPRADGRAFWIDREGEHALPVKSLSKP